jgi:putative FmdB family regulatory protein
MPKTCYNCSGYLYEPETLLRKEEPMPAYDFACKDCGKEFTAFYTISEYQTKPATTCPGCGSDNLQRRITGVFAKTSKKS